MIKITEDKIKNVINEVEYSPPFSFINDSMEYRAGFVRALVELGLLDGLSATRILLKLESMEWNQN